MEDNFDIVKGHFKGNAKKKVAKEPGEFAEPGEDEARQAEVELPELECSEPEDENDKT